MGLTFREFRKIFFDMENRNFNQCARCAQSIDNHLVLAVLTTVFCCLPFGIISIIYAVQVNSALAVDNYELAKANSEKAKFWGMLALAIGAIGCAGYFVFGVAVAML